jgi:hypothetical protein
MRKHELEVRCPLNDWASCPSEKAGTCWDMSDRATDCSCAANPYGACPATPCRDGLNRDPETCDCTTEVYHFGKSSE